MPFIMLRINQSDSYTKWSTLNEASSHVLIIRLCLNKSMHSTRCSGRAKRVIFDGHAYPRNLRSRRSRSQFGA